jgi:HEAT repeat protein
MFHDTHDWALRVRLVDALNTLPGVNIYYNPADGRRSLAARLIGDFGPPAKAAVPVLIQALKGSDKAVHEAAIAALGKIHSEPETVIPLLIPYLDDENVNDEAADALANYGRLAKPAVPKLIPLLKARDKDAREAAQKALVKIDPEAAAQAGVKRR